MFRFLFTKPRRISTCASFRCFSHDTKKLHAVCVVARMEGFSFHFIVSKIRHLNFLVQADSRDSIWFPWSVSSFFYSHKNAFEKAFLPPSHQPYPHDIVLIALLWRERSLASFIAVSIVIYERMNNTWVLECFAWYYPSYYCHATMNYYFV